MIKATMANTNPPTMPTTTMVPSTGVTATTAPTTAVEARAQNKTMV